ncbi:SDR family NAD(P)-dependent oxidoreductase [Streptomyces sp. NPDC093252]|uniref:SDR family NAD(P)-dependent oxidoreductase n=1 Tax=Streptomyces sp. NPDC093252 TaxID=3154980 RepID=UPI00341748BE
MMTSRGLLEGRRAFVTGAAQGIGAATARRFAEEGASVAVADLDGGGAAAQASALTDAGFDAFGITLDVADDAAVKAAIDRTAERFGGLDVVVANAGVGPLAAAETTPTASFERTLRINVSGVYSSFVHAIPHLRAAGGGQLLATSSLASKAGVAFMSAYCASKFAVVGMVQALSKELGRDQIRVNAVAPGFVETSLLDTFMPFQAQRSGTSEGEARSGIIDGIPLGRLVQSHEVADAFVYLASPLASAVSGEVITVSGGGV